MVLAESMQFNQNTADNLNPADSTIPLLKKNNEKLSVEEGASKFTTQTIGHSWIVGSATNGLVGTNTGTQDGLQQVVGGAGRGDSVIVFITSPNNVFTERFHFTTFEDTATTTATWDTTNGRLSL